MKYSLSSTQVKKYLDKADELKITWKNNNQILDFIEEYPNKTFSIIVPKDADVDWKQWHSYELISKNRIYFCLFDLNMADKCKENNILFYYAYPVNTFYEAQGLKNIGVSYIKIAPPLTHMMNEIKKLNVLIRITPNIAYNAYIPHTNGIYGGWVRPEDIDTYGEYVDIVEFEDCNKDKEQGLYRIYAEQKEWPGDLSLLISNFGVHATNRLINPIHSRYRMNCGQKCQQFGACKICDRMIAIADEEKLRSYIEETKNDI